MTPVWILTYAVIFVAGPLIVLRLLRGQASVAAVRSLGLATVLMVVAAIGATMLGASGVVSAGFLWVSWILSMALMGQVLRLIMGGGGSRRWTAAVAAMGAVLPWFGLLTAQAMAG